MTAFVNSHQKQIEGNNDVKPIYDYAYGDLYVTYEVRLPTNLTEKQRDLFTELSKLK